MVEFGIRLFPNAREHNPACHDCFAFQIPTASAEARSSSPLHENPSRKGLIARRFEAHSNQARTERQERRIGEDQGIGATLTISVACD